MSHHETTAVDPVCGMTVDVDKAARAELRSEHNGIAYYFCGKGCKLDFAEDPERYLDPGNAPTM